MAAPLADLIRPDTLDDVVGQAHLLGAGKPLRRIVESGHLPNLIFYGPSGVGKTTVARILADMQGKRLHRLNGTTASTEDIKRITAETGTIAGIGGIVLYLDEIQYLNKKQQQTLLSYIETGEITLIASTTENPYFTIYNAILSRCTVFEFLPIPPKEAERAVKRGFALYGEQLGTPIETEPEVIPYIARVCGGDIRKCLNTVELASLAADTENGKRLVTLSLAEALSQKSAMRYDRDGDMHYDILSAFQKSIRGSDENAALHYLARLLEANDLLSACRRLLVIAAEDIGLAYPQAFPIVKACTDAAVQLGLPEARIPLAEAVILLATAPKSNSAICAIDAALSDIKAGKGGEVPSHLQDTHYAGAEKLGRGGYQYPHNFPHHYLKQQYLPDTLQNAVYYEYGDNKTEQAAKAYWEKIKNSQK